MYCIHRGRKCRVYKRVYGVMHVLTVPFASISPRWRGLRGEAKPTEGTETQAAPELPKVGGLIQRGTEELMAQKGHGTTASKVQENLRWGCDRDTADRVRRRATRRNSAQFLPPTV